MSQRHAGAPSLATLTICCEISPALQQRGALRACLSVSTCSPPGTKDGLLFLETSWHV
jgi:hypothetical protein